MFEISLRVSVGRLKLAGWEGRRTVYVAVTLGRRTWWVQRWDTPRCSNHRVYALSSDGKMAYTAGRRVAGVPVGSAA